ncbi:MAG: MFS transporter, partial [Candidatus Eremiobacteraeota bacterium]|nr:MFS transporter [Candidatus Eremiobacteraeota bacterium]
VGKASNRLGDRVMSSLGLVLLVSGFALAPFVHNVYTLTAVMILFATGGGFAQNGLVAMISNAATEREQGTVLGVSSSLDSLSGILAPPVSTGLLARYGSPFASVEPLIMSAIALVLGIRNSLRTPRVAPNVTDGSVVTPPAEELV